MASILEDLSVYLPTAGLGLTFGTNFFAGMLPDQPDVCTAIFEYPGSPPEHVMGKPTPRIAHPRVQILVRQPDVAGAYLLGRNLIDLITTTLENQTGQTFNGTHYIEISRIQDPFLLHRDPARRWFFACNLMIRKDG